ncbi:MAG: MFS transporter [Desulfobacteraceae bacterium]|nr:MFS transporter [Desulfobacteraceae bacterium]
MDKKSVKLQIAVFALVSAAFTNIYITQPVLPVLQEEFGVSPVQVSMTVSFVILGIILSNLFFGYLADVLSIRPIIVAGSLCVAAGGLISCLTHDFRVLLAARMFQGLFIPALTTSLAAYLSKTLPGKKLSVVMGAYVSATVLGGLGGRLLGGWIHPPLHWRYAFLSASLLILCAMAFACAVLPPSGPVKRISPREKAGFLSLLARRDLLWPIACGGAGFLMFQPIFNFLPYRLAAPPFHFSTGMITLTYFVYVLGFFMGPLAGNLSARMGSGNILMAASGIFGLSIGLLFIPSVPAVVAGLLGTCAGFFTIHAVAIGLLNSKLSSGQGKANALYVLFYYCGGWIGITGAGFCFQKFGWNGVLGFVLIFLGVPLVTGWIEKNNTDKDRNRK